VARLVAAGRSNPAIARELGISRKTVANHVARIFECLDLRARWQLTPDLLDRRV
jgi:DNA-binding NarL/FixJ family response regulator